MKTPVTPGRALAGPVLYARSRELPLAVAALAGTALLAAWAAHAPGPRETYGGLPYPGALAALAPPLVAAVIGTSLHPRAEELDRAAARPWWPRRLAHLSALTALAVAALAAAVPWDTGSLGGPALVRNTVGAVGVTAAAARVVGARPSWLPATAYLGAVFLAAPRAHGAAAAVWAWPLRPGPEPAAWAVAGAVLLCGGALYVRGARPLHPVLG
ncbi:hypothetical protein [Streptomyces sp. GC420]|uniref:hypothetical protein n=1 Tax=Streptomyces sp. GC420 TaxID=2697568 RepID=UPI001414E11A|nr:hypothetical protein [Streptomyces sp. GC420]NBM20046.1 hypothetical protein [Streptomyces sp. GC420]